MVMGKREDHGSGATSIGSRGDFWNKSFASKVCWWEWGKGKITVGRLETEVDIKKQAQIISKPGLMMGMGKREDHGTNSIGSRGLNYWSVRTPKKSKNPTSYDGYGKKRQWLNQKLDWKQRYKLQVIMINLDFDSYPPFDLILLLLFSYFGTFIYIQAWWWEWENVWTMKQKPATPLTVPTRSFSENH